MKLKEKVVIWSSEVTEDDIEFAKENLIENGIDASTVDESEIYEWASEDKYIWLQDEIKNLDVEIGCRIIAFGTIGLWNGTRNCIKDLNSTNLSSILNSSNSCDECEWYVDTDGDVCFTGYHHDGSLSITFRAVKVNANLDKVLEELDKYAFNENECDESYLWNATKSLGPYVQKVYGFKTLK